VTVPRRWLLLAALGLALALPACKKRDPTVGSGVGATKARSVGAFSAIRVGGGLEFDVTVGKSAPLEVTGDDNLLGYVTSRVENGTLVLDVGTKLKRKQPLRVRVGTEGLAALHTGGGAKGKVRGVRSEAFEVEAAGGAKLAIAGSSQRLSVTTRKAARVDLNEFSAATAVVSASDTSTVELGHLEELDVVQKGLSRVVYRGAPKLTQSVTKPARLIHRD
jgi:hypothetical protein